MVSVGQIWKENPRYVSNRLLRVDMIDNGYAFCQEGYTHDNQTFLPHKALKKARIRADRLKPSLFTLFKDR